MLFDAEPPLRADTQGNIWELNTVRIFRVAALRQLGRWRELRDETAEHLRDAMRRGDRYAATTLSRSANLAWLIADDPARARREIDARDWMAPVGRYHMQHWYELRARSELALYEGDAATGRDLLAAAEDGIRRALLLRAQTIRTEYEWIRGKSALARVAAGEDPALLAIAARQAKALRGEGVGYATTWARLLDAGVAARSGVAPRPILEDARRLADANDLAMIAAACRLALDDARGEEAMRAETIKRPDRVLAMLIPGL